MKDKTIRMNWKEWEEYCAEHGIDPRENREDYYDLGGGNSITFECLDDPPEEDEEPAPAKLQNCKCQIIAPEERTKCVCPECGYTIIEAPTNIIDPIILGTGLETKFTCTGCGKEGKIIDLVKKEA